MFGSLIPQREGRISKYRKIPFLLTISIILELASGSLFAGPTLINVYWDISHGVNEDNYSPSGQFSVLLDHLGNEYQFTEGNDPLDEADLELHDILVIASGSASQDNFRPVELMAIDSFIRQGGSLLLLSETRGASGIAQVQQVADLFNVRIGIVDFPGNDVNSTRIEDHAAVEGVDRVYIRFSSTFSPGDLTPIVWKDLLPMVATGIHGTGKIVLIADNDIFTELYFDREDNRKLSESVFRYLSTSCETIDNPLQDLNSNGILDICEPDCNDNGVPDITDIQTKKLQDCDANGIPDECDINNDLTLDCNDNGIPDSCDIATSFSQDCDTDGVPDECFSTSFEFHTPQQYRVGDNPGAIFQQTSMATMHPISQRQISGMIMFLCLFHRLAIILVLISIQEVTIPDLLLAKISIMTNLSISSVQIFYQKAWVFCWVMAMGPSKMLSPLLWGEIQTM